MNDMRWASIDAFAEQNRDNILRDITRLVAVPSVEGTPEPGAPFGAGPRAALDKALEIAGELGLDTFNADGYIGWAETGRIAACGTAGCWAAAWPMTRARASSACMR